ncbi:MAG TPA: hypothetical protein VF103_11700 [Polyangiaceae bacterium]
MYEHKTRAPLSRQHFRLRFARHFLAAAGIVVGSLGIGMLGYEHFEHLSWLDGFLNSAMLLGGMGPVDPPKTDGGKVFAGLYALYAGLVFLVTAAILAGPVLHRLLHKFHWESSRS